MQKVDISRSLELNDGTPVLFEAQQGEMIAVRVGVRRLQFDSTGNPVGPAATICPHFRLRNAPPHEVPQPLGDRHHRHRAIAAPARKAVALGTQSGASRTKSSAAAVYDGRSENCTPRINNVTIGEV